jgi:hypothetical protein
MQNNGWGAFLNRYTGNYVDWNRVGELLRSGRHVYSWEELKVRSLIVIGSISGTIVGANLLKHTINKSWIRYGVSGILSFGIVHALAIDKLILKRARVKDKILNLCDEIKDLASSLDPSKNKVIMELVQEVLLVEAKNNASSMTLGLRKRLLRHLLDELKQGKYELSLDDLYQLDSDKVN